MPIKATKTITSLDSPGSREIDKPPSLLNIWVFNGNIAFSSTAEPKSPLSAVKLLYRLVSQEDADKMLDSMTSDVQDITLPVDAINTVASILAKSNSLVPESDRYFKEWAVGLIEKWDSPDVPGKQQ